MHGNFGISCDNFQCETISLLKSLNCCKVLWKTFDNRKKLFSSKNSTNLNKFETINLKFQTEIHDKNIMLCDIFKLEKSQLFLSQTVKQRNS